MSDTPGSHGNAGRREATFTRLFDKRLKPFNQDDLKALAKAMLGNANDKPSNDPDGEENLMVPAGYTYFGQFVDHDLTFDTTSSLDNAAAEATNLRTPRLDLDCVYGTGPVDQPYMYASEDKITEGVRAGASLALGNALEGTPGRRDLLRIGSGRTARAVIGDPRNDENSIVCNIQLAFIAFHNAVVRHLADQSPASSKDSLFTQARQIVRWTYQRIVVEDYLQRIVEPATYFTFRHRLDTMGEGAFALYTAPLRSGLPIEFAGAAYRFGHSMVRTGYKLNTAHDPQFIFTPGEGDNSLLGFGPLPATHWIQWRRFFPVDNKIEAGQRTPQNTDSSEDRLQYAYRIDTTLVDPLRALPAAIDQDGRSLAQLNLLRGNVYGLVSGQTVADALGVPALDARYLVVRDSNDGPIGFKPVSAVAPSLMQDTPLWYYILAEAQRPLVDMWLAKNGGQAGPAKLVDDDLKQGLPDANGKRNAEAPVSQLGPVGGMILMETFYGLLMADTSSFLRAGPQEQALMDRWFEFFTAGHTKKISMWRLLEIAGQA